jgi:hypothetical protein
MLALIRLILNTMKVFVAFVCFTLLFYYGLLWLNGEYQDMHRYDEPEGRAVKVFGSFHQEEKSTWIDRLKLFYDIGE